MKIQNFASIGDYIDRILGSPREYKLFRGQKDSNWALETRWQRFRRDNLATTTNSEEFRKQMNINLRSEFRKTEMGEEGMDDTRLETLGQHHGLPTRLMDWSYSPYVGLFFAFDAAESSKPNATSCAVFELDIEKFTYASALMIHNDRNAARTKEAEKHAFSESLGMTNPRILLNNDRINRRMIRQEGVFLFLPDSIESLEKFEDDCKNKYPADPDCEFLTKCVLPMNDRLFVIKQLHQMGSPASSIYCDSTYSTTDAANFTLFQNS